MANINDEVQFVRCMKCLKVIQCSRYDTKSMVEHIKLNHPEIMTQGTDKQKKLHQLAAQHGISQERLSEIGKMTGMTEDQLADAAERYLASQKSQAKAKPSGCACKAPASESTDKNRLSYYRASIEKWAPTDGCIYCPACGLTRQPLIKTNAEIFTANGCCMACIASCWPFCFLPCFMSQDNKEYLHCSNCNTFLGLYDRENNCIKPSRQFVPKKANKKAAAFPPSKKCN